ncbi:ribbon-helix-helix domain-containing protein [Thermodesulfobacteriota bacterium]
MTEERQEVITFKVPESLKEAMKGIPNRSEFIRSAILMALERVCPLCKGTGILMPNQKIHWDEFAKEHSLQECGTCNARHLVCLHETRVEVHPDDSP